MLSPKIVEFLRVFQEHFDLNKGLAGTFSDCGGLIRRNNNIEDYTVSKAVDTFAKKPKSKPFMC